MNESDSYDEERSEGVRVTDKRRIDPETGEVRTPPGEGAPAAPAAEAEAEAPEAPAEAPVEDREGELTADLQRLSAEYANYRKRAERDREAFVELGAASVFGELLHTLDDLDRAREHNEFEGTLKSIGESLEGSLAKLGLEKFGSVGDVFDPNQDEALTHAEGSAEDERAVPGETVSTQVYRAGYRYKGRVLRAAQVGVTEYPGTPAAQSENNEN